MYNASMSFEEWIKRKDKYLTSYTLYLIKEYWRKCNLEDDILYTLYKLWCWSGSQYLKWKRGLVQHATSGATEWAKGKANERMESLCKWLEKALKYIENFYKRMVI